jgi:FMN phosphatase YigB (HAD superfamily)
MDDKIALFDLDGTLADYEKQLREDLLKLAAPTDPPLKFKWDAEDPWIKARMDLIKSKAGWWQKLPTIPSGFLVLNLARAMGFEAHVLTKGPRKLPLAWGEKLAWCQKHIDTHILITVTQDKGLVYGRVLCDDFPPYMERWLEHRPRGLGLMPEGYQNASFTHPNVVKYPRDMQLGDRAYMRVKEALEAAFTR